MAKPRSIFEEVGPDGPSAAAPAPVRRRLVWPRQAIAVWLMVLFALVAAMIVLGGLTRLTDSGLSIPEWRPVTGALPPTSAGAWDAEFGQYRATPQAQLANSDMTLDQFKVIYWWEWSHRQLGRLIGAVWALGFLWFWARRRLPPGWTPRLLGLGILGGLQGAIGWWMVASGLSGSMVSVASYRLAVHLGLGFAILGLIAWFVLTLRRDDAELLQARRQRNPGLMAWGAALIAVAFLQVLLGALVAGIDAGRDFTDWPLMAGRLFPTGAFDLQPLWSNFFANPALVQFNHRLVAYALLVLGFLAWWLSRSSALGSIRRAFDAMAAMLLLQVALGVATLVNAAPLPLAILHQLGAVLLFVLVIRARFTALYPAPQRIARGR